jgi:Flp pilus assembly pilin Flp
MNPRQLLRRAKGWVPRPLARVARRIAADVHEDERGAALIEFALSVPLLAMTAMISMAVMFIIQARFGVQAAVREAAVAGAMVSTAIDPLDRAVEAAEAEGERVLEEYRLRLDQATIEFPDNSPILKRGSLFHVHITYIVNLPLPTLAFFRGAVGGSGPSFTVESHAVVPVQRHKARWPCPSPDPICG